MRFDSCSASSYSVTEWCHWKYYLSYILNFEETGPKSAAWMGSLAHSVFEVLSKASMVNHYKESKIWNIDYLWKICFDYHYKNDALSASLVDNAKLRKVCRGVHDLIKSEYSPIRSNTIDVEVYFNQEIIDPRFELQNSIEHNKNIPIKDQIHKYFSIRGFIDRIDKINNDTIELLDYKSGSMQNYKSQTREKLTGLDLRESIQPMMYHLAAKKLYPWAKNILVTFLYFTNENGAITYPFSNDDSERTIETLYKRMKTMQATNDPDRTIIPWKCKCMCSYSKDGTCDKVWQEKNEMGHKFIEEKYAILNVRGKRK